jgi:hypothetical protein
MSSRALAGRAAPAPLAAAGAAFAVGVAGDSAAPPNRRLAHDHLALVGHDHALELGDPATLGAQVECLHVDQASSIGITSRCPRITSEPHWSQSEICCEMSAF